ARTPPHAAFGSTSEDLQVTAAAQCAKPDEQHPTLLIRGKLCALHPADEFASYRRFRSDRRKVIGGAQMLPHLDPEDTGRELDSGYVRWSQVDRLLEFANKRETHESTAP